MVFELFFQLRDGATQGWPSLISLHFADANA